MTEFSEVCTIIDGIPDWQIAKWEDRQIPAASEREWLSEMPEARPQIVDLAQIAKDKRDYYRQAINDYFAFKAKTPSDKSWFYDEAVKVLFGEAEAEADKELKRLMFLLRESNQAESKPTRRTIAEVLERPRLTLVELLQSNGVKLRALNGGKRFIAKCPFHDEKTPSFWVFQDHDRQRYYCFGCGVKGDALDYLKKAGYGQQQALEMLS